MNKELSSLVDVGARFLCRRLWAFSLVVLLPVAAHADAVDDYVHAEMAKRRIPAMSVAVIRDGRVVKEATYGLASIELNAPATMDTSYVLASMTKVFTAAAIMQLVEQGKISLDEPVTKILPQLPAQWSAITIRHCLSHTSGLPDAMMAGDDINTIWVSGDRSDLLEQLAKKPLGIPGEKSSYNQTGYVLLAMVIEKVGGQNYEKYVQDHLLNPGGLTNARFGDAWAIIPGRADLYTALDISTDHSRLLVRDGVPVVLTDKILRYGSKSIPDYLNAAGGLNGSIRDLVSWETVLADGKILKASSVAEMTKPFKLRNGKDGDFGLGFLIYSVGSKKDRAVAYGGGAATWRLQIPADKLTVIVLTNLQDSQPNALTQDIAALYAPELAKHSTQ